MICEGGTSSEYVDIGQEILDVIALCERTKCETVVISALEFVLSPRCQGSFLLGSKSIRPAQARVMLY